MTRVEDRRPGTAMMSIAPLLVCVLLGLQDPKPDASKPVSPTPTAPKPTAPKPPDAKPADAKPAQSAPTETRSEQAPTQPVLEEAEPREPKVEPARNPSDNPLLSNLARSRWTPMDEVMIIVNQDIVTNSELRRAIRRTTQQRPITNQTEAERRRDEVLGAMARQKLAAQGGQDLGLSEELIDLMLKDQMDQWVESKGGVVEAAKVLESRDLTSQEFRQELREDIYANTWQDMVRGTGPGAGKRPQHDRFVRPGELKLRFVNDIQDPAKYSDLGGRSETFSVQRIVLDPDENGGMEKTTALAKDLRRRIAEEGDDMTELVQKYGVDKENNGVLRDVNAEQVGRSPAGKELAEFARRAKPEEVSEPMLLKGAKKTFVQIVRVVDKTESVKPDLGSPEVQKAMRKAQQLEMDNYRLIRAYGELEDAAYIWPEELKGEK